MKVKMHKNYTKSVPFYCIREGEYFIYGDKLFYKMEFSENIERIAHNALCLTDSFFYWFTCEQSVHKIHKIEIIYE